MKDLISVAVLGSTGYVGLELINLLSLREDIEIKFLGSESYAGHYINEFDKRIKNTNLPKLDLIKNIDLSNIDITFLALPHSLSHNFVKNNFNKSNFIDLSADFRITNSKIYNKYYNNKHSCPELINNFVCGIPEIYFDLIKNSKNISIPGCYPTSILIPLIPLIRLNKIDTENIIIDSKSGYSGAGKKFDKKNIYFNNEYNFYNYNTNQHRHMCEIEQELTKFTKSKIKFSFNPHILPIFRGMMSTIYCDLKNNTSVDEIKQILIESYSRCRFVKIINDETRADFFKVQNTNNCYIKIFKHFDNSKIIITSLIDNLLKGASGQAVQCMNVMYNKNEAFGFDSFL